MPPKQKFSREEIISASLNIVRREGIAGVTARSLAAELGSSARPIFTMFSDMEEVVQETISAARQIYNQYTQAGLADKVPFKGVGMAYLKFALEEPKLFHLLFMSENSPSPELSGVLFKIDANSSKILKTIQDQYHLELTEANKLYLYLWIFTHGIATLAVNGVCRFTSDEMSAMLTDVFTDILKGREQK